MKYKVGDRVKIKEDIVVYDLERNTVFIGSMKAYRGKIMTIEKVMCDGVYRMNEGWEWAEEWIEGLAEPEISNTEILELAIDTYGDKKQALVCIEEMSELTKALIKLSRADESEKEKAKEHVQEEIADVCVMMQQAKMMFGEKEIDRIMQRKIYRLYDRLKDEQDVVKGVRK